MGENEVQDIEVENKVFNIVVARKVLGNKGGRMSYLLEHVITPSNSHLIDYEFKFIISWIQQIHTFPIFYVETIPMTIRKHPQTYKRINSIKEAEEFIHE
ncbi:hypothetical protein KP509_38G038300 [Ceratopteris richardii]|uniref:Uncharacterized protein n=1 Tax=Ceratopteris richardii TaxID=49495 RepID=A0A8T2Q393_CERRI|nr:hypothetical protein KP509_38G038300 [Ceratopteris richardii]